MSEREDTRDQISAILPGGFGPGNESAEITGEEIRIAGERRYLLELELFSGETKARG